MTTTDDRPVFKLTEADRPEQCPSWCATDNHDPAIWEPVSTEEELATARVQFREHESEDVGYTLPALFDDDRAGRNRSVGEVRELRAGGDFWALSLRDR